VDAMFSTLLGLDANDPPKTLATLELYCSVLSSVSSGDVFSKANLFPEIKTYRTACSSKGPTPILFSYSLHASTCIGWFAVLFKAATMSY
jgi:hypothetical protein